MKRLAIQRLSLDLIISVSTVTEEITQPDTTRPDPTHPTHKKR